MPLLARRISAGLAVSTVDGLHLAVRPLIGLLSVPAALAGGFVVGARHPGFVDVFTESLWLLVGLAFLGAVSGTIGLYFTLGFAAGDLILGEHPLWPEFLTADGIEPVAKYGSWLLSYALMALLVVGVPIAAKSLAGEFSLPVRVGRAARGAVAVVSVVGITTLLVYVWTQSAPLLVRPVFVWADRLPTVPAIAPLQEHTLPIVGAGAAGALLRVAILLALAGRASASARGGHAPAGARLLALERRFATAHPVRPLLSRVPLLLRIAGRSLLLTALLSGVLADYSQAAIALGVLFVAQVLMSPLIPINLGPVSRFLNRIPRLIRLAVALVPVALFGTTIFDRFLQQNTTSFVPFLVATMITAVLMMLLLPSRRTDRRDGAR